MRQRLVVPVLVGRKPGQGPVHCGQQSGRRQTAGDLEGQPKIAGGAVEPPGRADAGGRATRIILGSEARW